ncbi:MAG: hypothetical protein K2N94_07775 [Lachnospiraceae bacterium]|nr:hypothetical protein [Lachnospiraceae bacterium]
MIISTLERDYRVIHRGRETENFEVLLCRTGQETGGADCTLLRFFDREEIRRILEQNLLRRGITESFTDYRESFIWHGDLVMVFRRREGTTLGHYLRTECPPPGRRLEIGRRLLERLLLMNMPDYLLAGILNEKCILVTEGGEVAIRYEPDEIHCREQEREESLRSCFCRIFSLLLSEGQEKPAAGIRRFLEQLEKEY